MLYLLLKEVEFKWTLACQLAFEHIKHLRTTTSIMRVPIGVFY